MKTGRSLSAVAWVCFSFAPLVRSAEDKEATPAAEAVDDYRNLITQSAPAGRPASKLFEYWILTEANNDSLMRQEIGKELEELQSNGRNANSMVSYYTPEKQYVNRLQFKPGDMAIKCTGGGREGVYDYQVLMRASDYGHRSKTVIQFRFTFQARTEYFKYTKGYMVTVISYPKYVGKTETDGVP